MPKTFCVVGHDARQQAAARVLRRAGYGVTAADNAAAADYILLPMSQGRVSDEVARALQGAGQGTLILAGRPGMPVRMAAREAGLPLIDYFLRPELECLNAVPTAEGCLELLLRLRERTIWESGFLVLGYGRVGRAVARRLVLLGGRVTVAARSPEQRANARCAGCRAAPLTALPTLLPGFDAVINTIPAPVLPRALLQQLPGGALIIDLASLPGRHRLCRRRGTGSARRARPGPAGPLCAADSRGADCTDRAGDSGRTRSRRKEHRPMTTQSKRTVAFALCGSFCSFAAVLPQLRVLTARGWDVLPVLSASAAGLDTRFGTASALRQTLYEVTGHRPLTTLQAVEPLGPQRLAEALIIAPATGTTMALLAAGISSTPVTLAAKSLLRGGRPIIIAPSTNDGLSGSAPALGQLLQRRSYYFVPFGQDDSYKKPCSLKSDFTLLPDTLEAALRGVQIQPLLL